MAEHGQEVVELTQEEMQQQLAERDERIRKMEVELKQARTETISFAKRDAGWLVTTPSIMFSGKKYDIPFVYGQTFIRETQEVRYFKGDVEPMAKGQLHKFLKQQYPIPPHTTAEHKEKEKEIRAREKELLDTGGGTAFKAAVHLFADFGYDVKRFEPDQVVELESRMKKREDEARGVLEEEYKDKLTADILIKPGYFGESPAEKLG